jgi:hypothetical protein
MTGTATLQMAIRDTLLPRACLTIDQLDEALPDIPRREIIKAVGRMINNGRAERIERGCYQLTDIAVTETATGKPLTSGPRGPDTAIARKPLTNSLRQRAWNVMRLPGTFTVPELIAVAQKSKQRDAHRNLQRYCKALCKAGYLVELPVREKGTRQGSNGFKRYRLINDTGETAPVLRQRTKVVFDHNTKKQEVL